MAARRGHGEDSVYRDGDRWRGALDLGFAPDGRRLRKKVSGRTKTEVLAKLRDLRRAVDQGLPVPDDRLTVAEFLERWVRTVLPGQVADSTKADYADTVRLHLAPTLGRIVLSRLTVAQVDALWAVKREKGYSPNSLRIMRAVLRRALGQAERENLLRRNVAALSTPPRVRSGGGRTLTVEQARQLLVEVQGHRLEAAVTLLLGFGLRRGEGAGPAMVGPGRRCRHPAGRAGPQAGPGVRPRCGRRSTDPDRAGRTEDAPLAADPLPDAAAARRPGHASGPPGPGQAPPRAGVGQP